MLSPKGVCFDINECNMGTHTCARPGGVCVNAEGGHTCDGCEEGYLGDGVTCTDIDECAEESGDDTTGNQQQVIKQICHENA